MRAPIRFAMLVLALLAPVPAAAAPWSRVEALPATTMNGVWANADTLVVAADSTTWLSTDAGATWTHSALLPPGVTTVTVARFRNGRLYAGTYGQGVFASDDRGATWQPYSQGLVGGLFDSQLYIGDLLVRGDSLYAATSGAGPWVRNLVAGTWSPFGTVFEPNQASNMNAIAAGGGRLLACAGFNGTVFFRDGGAPDWTLSWLDDAGIVPGLGALAAHWTGTGWIVGSNVGVFTSAAGEAPWTFVDVGLGTLFFASFTGLGNDVVAAFQSGSTAVFETSADDGATWQELEALPLTFVFALASRGTDLYAARSDGLWRRSLADVSVPPGGGLSSPALALAGAQPVGDVARFRLELAETAPATLELFDVLGRRMSPRLDEVLTAGRHERELATRELAPGVYLARLRAGGGTSVVRFVRAR